MFDKNRMSMDEADTWKAAAWGLHQSSLSPEALVHFAKESVKKVKRTKPSWFSGTTSRRTRCPN
jgi:hypothetical protein